MSSNGVYYTLVTDQVSSTALVVDASGNKVAETRYYPFGEERNTSGTSPTDKTYTGQRSEDFGLMVTKIYTSFPQLVQKRLNLTHWSKSL